jgi:hypothetical protein
MIGFRVSVPAPTTLTMLDGKERRDCESRGFCSTRNVSTNHGRSHEMKYAGGEDFGYFAPMEERVQSRLRSIVPWNRPGRAGASRVASASSRSAPRIDRGSPKIVRSPALERPRATRGRGGGEDDCYFVEKAPRRRTGSNPASRKARPARAWTASSVPRQSCSPVAKRSAASIIARSEVRLLPERREPLRSSAVEHAIPARGDAVSNIPRRSRDPW